ncbi:MAG: hypothetical protein OWT27_06290 [Firmicutes bacterium]|nr:hypothetical protein [Bacillota bacterium]
MADTVGAGPASSDMVRSQSATVSDIGAQPPSKLSEAIDLVNSAIGITDDVEMRKVAQSALELCEECVEAWLLLAQADAGDPVRVEQDLGSAVAAGDRLFAPREKELHGRYWQAPETRVYMQARVAHAQALWELDREAEAIEVLRGTLARNPEDHQGVRYMAMRALLDSGDYAGAMEVVSQYEQEGSTPILYNKLLCIFMVEGDGLLARSAFVAAKRWNPYVLDYLLGLRQLPQRLPQAIEPQGDSEAVRYAAVFGEAWAQASGAIAFLRAQKKLRADRERLH